MTMKLYEENDIQNIANEIRLYNEKEDKYRVEDITLGIQNIAKNIEDKLGTTKTVEDTNSLEYENAKAYRILNAEYQGNVEQETTSGVQLLNEIYYNNHTLYNKDGRYFAYIKLPDSFKTKFYGNMTLKGTSQSLVFAFSTISNGSSNERMLDNGTLSANIEYDFTNAENVYLVIGNSNDVNIATDIPKIFNNYNIMVSTTKGVPYEPYTGGQPSPSPDYPQDIEVMNGVNILQNNFILGTIGTSGQSIDATNRSRSDYTEVKPNTTYRFGSSNLKLYYVPYFYDEDKTFISYINGWKNQTIPFETPTNTKYVRILLKNNDTNTITLSEITEPQIVKGTEPKPYLPYNSIGVRRINQLFDNELRQGSWNDNTNTTRVFSKNSLYLKANKKYILKTNLDITKYKFGILVNDKPFPVTTSNFSYDSDWKTINELEFTTTQDGYFGLNIATLSGNDNLTPQDFNKYQFDLFNDERIDYIDLKGNELLTTDKIKIDSKGNVKLIKNWGKVVFQIKDFTSNGVSDKGFSIISPVVNNAMPDIITKATYMTHLDTKGSAGITRTKRMRAVVSWETLGLPSTSTVTESKAKMDELFGELITTCYYPLAIPEEIDLGKITLKSLEGLNNVEILATLEPTFMSETYMLNIQSKYLPKVTTEETSIDYVAQFPLDMAIEGNIEQETTTGKNLFDINGTKSDLNASIYKYEYNLKPNTQYTISSNCPSSNTANIYANSTSSNKKIHINNPQTITSDSNGYFYILVRHVATSEDSGTFNVYQAILDGRYWLQIEEGSTATEWEKYTGGQPSPSPDFPQPISTIENSLKITICNKNLLDNDKLRNSDFQMNIYRYTQTNIIGNKNLYFKAKLKEGKTSISGLYLCLGSKNNPNLSGSEVAWAIYKGNIVDSSSIHFPNHIEFTSNTQLYFSYFPTNISVKDLFDTYEFSVLVSDDEIEQHLETQITANLPEGEFIGKINDTYKDVLKVEYNEEDGQYHLNLYKNIGKVVLDGSESGWYFNSQQHGFSINGQIGTPISPIMVSNNFICKNTYNTWTGKETFGTNTSGTLWFETTVASSVDDFKAWLSTHNIEVYYALAIPYTVDLGKQNKLMPFEGINNIEVLAELEPSKIKTTYYIDAKRYIEDTTSALLELGGEN